jgi:uncharacterized protein
MARQQSTRDLLVDVESLRQKSSPPRRIVIDTVLDDLCITNARVGALEPIHLDAVLEAVHEGVLVTGTIATRWSGQCRRCLEDASGALVVSVCELCVEHGDEETTYPLGAEKLDLAPIVHDACILNLPLAPLCTEDCLGLCPGCGANRNFEPCACRPAIDPRFAGLSLLTGAEQAEGVDESGRGPETTS